MKKLVFDAVVCVAAVVCLTSVVQAKTVALWPIEWNEGRYGLDAHCRVDPANDLASRTALTSRPAEAPGKGLPPNPSSDVIEDFACNYSSYAATDTKVTSGAHYSYASTDLSITGPLRYVAPTNDLTVELFFRVDTLPTSDGWVVLAGYNPQNSNSDRWFVSLRHHKNGYYYWNMVGIQWTGGKDVNSSVHIADADAEAYFADWHHMAAVYHHDLNGKAVARFYVDSQIVCESEQPVVTSYPTTVHVVEELNFGGRSGGQRLYGSIDYIRMSDEALEPSGFLTAGSAGWHVPGEHKTVAYWPLASKDGVMDGRNALGGAPLQMLISPAWTNNLDLYHVSPDSRKAFAGAYPPNRNMTPAVTVDMPDNGCVQQRNAYGDNMRYSCLRDMTLGADLTLTNDFTVEGWFFPAHVYPGNTQLLFASDAGTNNARWHLFLSWADYVWTLKMFVRDGTTDLIKDVAISGDLTDWTDWKHVALVHEATGGTGGVGKWTLYLDGAAAGSLEDSGAISASYKPSASFSLGGRWNNDNRCFVGCIDQVRACKTALVPSQFLNATTGATAATDVLRYWPLNVQDGVAVDGRDATGQGADLASRWTDVRLPKAFDEAPVVANPDRSVVGVAAPTTSVRFMDTRESTTTENRKNSSLATFDRATLELANAKRSMTMEYYYRSFKSAAATSGWELMLSFVRNPKIPASGSAAWDWRSLFNYKDQKKFYFYYTETIWGTNSTDTSFLNGGSMVYDGAWHHIAIVRELADPTNYVFRVYQDGTPNGIATQALTRATASIAGEMIIGGRWASDTSFNGALSSIRITDGVLTPAQFLNATPTTPVSATTNAWYAKTAALPYKVINCGLWTAPNESFTLEAKVTLPATVTDPIELMGAYESNASQPSLAWVGWKLSLKPDGTPHIEGSCGPKSGKFLLDDFSGSLADCLGKAVRLAISYDANDGIGTWKLYANGTLVGTLQNAFNPRGMFNEATGYDFLPMSVLVGKDLTGAARDLRQTRGVLAADELLADKGLLILVR